MSKDIKDYLHLYLGCEVFCSNSYATKGHVYKIYSVGRIYCEVSSEAEETTFRCAYSEIKPILRPLSDMTEEEKKDVDNWPHPVNGKMTTTFEIMRYLLSKGFDLFELIPEGLAIDKTKLSKEQNVKLEADD